MRFDGHVRSGKSTGFVSKNARYFLKGIPEPAGVGTVPVVFTKMAFSRLRYVGDVNAGPDAFKPRRGSGPFIRPRRGTEEAGEMP